MSPRAVTVLVAASSPAARARLEGAIARAPWLQLVCAPERPLAEALRARRPDVVLIDRADARAARLRDEVAETGTRVVALADEPRRVRIEGPVRGVLPRDAAPEAIAAAIAAVAAGLTVRAADAARRRAVSLDPAEPLTPREIDVLRMLGLGLGNRAIGERLGISAHTAKYHVASILGKLGAARRAEAVAIGIRRGLVPI